MLLARHRGRNVVSEQDLTESKNSARGIVAVVTAPPRPEISVIVPIPQAKTQVESEKSDEE